MPDLHLSRGRLVLSRGGYLLCGTSDCFWQELAQFGEFGLPGNFVSMLGTVIDIHMKIRQNKSGSGFFAKY